MKPQHSLAAEVLLPRPPLGLASSYYPILQVRKWKPEEGVVGPRSNEEEAKLGFVSGS